MNPFQQIKSEIVRAVNKVRKDLPRIVGKTAVDHYKENFDKEGFVNGGVEKWKDVKRRDSKSPWYGFEYKGDRATYRLKKRKGAKGYQSGGRNKTNFSNAATKRKILSGSTHELKRSLRYVAGTDQVAIVSDKPYAEVQNEGGPIKIFGRGSVILPARPFVGESIELDKKISDETDKLMDNLFK